MAKIFCLRMRFRAVAAAAVFTVGSTGLAVPALAVTEQAPAPGSTQAPAASEPAPVQAASDPDEAAQATDRFIVQFTDRAGASSADRIESYSKLSGALGAPVTELHETATGGMVVEMDQDLTADETAAAVAVLAADPGVAFVEPDVLLYPAAAEPNDPFYAAAQWNLRAAGGGANVAAAWNLGAGERQVVAVVDTGITAHTDLSSKVLPGYDMISTAGMAGDGDGRDANPRDEGDGYDSGACGRTIGAKSTWHGTHVSGIVAASTNNGVGISGVAPDAMILPVRTMGTCGGYMSDISDGIIWAAGGQVPGLPLNPTPARVINLSLGGVSTCSSSMQQAVDYAVGRGAVVVAAAGNDAISASRSQPANCANVVVVAAGDREGARAPYSNFGSVVDIIAPGGTTSGDVTGGIMSTLNSGTSKPARESYDYYQGTSMAAPHVAGTAALLLAANPALTSAQVELILTNTARALPGNCSPHCGPGLLDAGAAMVAAAPPFSDVSPSLQFHNEMAWMAGKGISTGWNESNGTKTYRPFEAVNRDAMAAFMYRLAGSPAYTPPKKSPFADVPTSSQFYKEISWLSSRGISTGWTEANGTRTYRPTTAVNRDAMAAFMYRFAESPSYTAPRKSAFRDVPTSSLFYKEISWLASSGISTGWEDGTFRPVTPVARDAMAAFMKRFDSKFGQ